jgi:nitrate reductase NapE component
MLQFLLIVKRFFSVEATKRRKRTNALVISCFLAVLSVLFVGGYGVVYTRCYNVMNKTPLNVFEVTQTATGTEIVILGKLYVI